MTSLVALCLFGQLFVSTLANRSAERTANTIEVKMYPLSKSEWNGDYVSSGFIDAVRNYANSYCSSNPSLCGGYSQTFTASDVGIVSTKDDSKSMYAELYIDIPGVSSSPYVLSADALQVILQNARDHVHDLTGSWITYIGDKYLGVPIQSTANAIIIPLACLTVVIVGVVTLFLTKWEEKKERKTRRQQRASTKKHHSDTLDNSFSVQHDSGVMLRPDRPRTAISHHGNGNKVVPNGDSVSYSQEKQISLTTRPMSKFRERTEMTSQSRNEFMPSDQDESRTAQGKVHTEVSGGRSGEAGSGAVTHSEVINGQLVDRTYVTTPTQQVTPPPLISATTPSARDSQSSSRVVSEEEAERKRRKREKRERRAEREREREMRKKLAEKDEKSERE